MTEYSSSKKIKPSSDVVSDGRQLTLDELIRPRQTEHSLSIDRAFPEEFVNDLSRQEVFNKHLFRPNTYLHKWWARRCGSTFRTILKQFAADHECRDYYAPGGLEGMTVLDPMMGGGTTLHEAIRLGANVIGADIDPIPIVQARASLTQVELAGLRVVFDRFFADLHDSLGPYFQTECPTCEQTVDIQYVLHGMRKKCACRNVVQIDQYDLRHEDDAIIGICPESGEIFRNQNGQKTVVEKLSPLTRMVGATTDLITKAEKECPSCGQKYEELLDLPFYARYTPIAIVATCPEHGTFFRSPSEEDLARIKRADERRSELDFGPLEDFRVHDGPKSGDLLRHNVRSYLDVFSSRQLLYLHQAIRQLRDYAGIDRLTLGMLLSTSLEFNAMLCGYKGWYKRRPGAIRHVFALHAYSFQYTVLENNPVNPRKSSGNLQLLFRDRIERGRKWSALPIERKIGEDGKRELVKIAGEADDGIEVFNQADLVRDRSRFWLIQGDSQRLPLDDHSVDMIVTDPPYYDSVQYSNLAAFFRVWLTRLLPDEAEWNYDESDSAVATKATTGVSNFMRVLAGIFAECGRVLKKQTGRMVFTFHHWDPSAWAELTLALKSAEFRLMNAYVVYSEHPISVHIRNLNSIRHDSVLVFALEGNEPSAPWTPLDTINTNDSETFCRQCNETLGWLLESSFSSAEIRAIWKSLIREGTDG